MSSIDWSRCSVAVAWLAVFACSSPHEAAAVTFFGHHHLAMDGSYARVDGDSFDRLGVLDLSGDGYGWSHKASFAISASLDLSVGGVLNRRTFRGELDGGSASGRLRSYAIALEATRNWELSAPVRPFLGVTLARETDVISLHTEAQRFLVDRRRAYAYALRGGVEFPVNRHMVVAPYLAWSDDFGGRRAGRFSAGVAANVDLTFRWSLTSRWSISDDRELAIAFGLLRH